MAKRTFAELNGYIDTNCSPRRAALLRSFLLSLEEKDNAVSKAPASSKVSHHAAYEGGLIDHIFSLTEYAAPFAGNAQYPGVTTESIVSVAVLHDIHKACDTMGNKAYVPNISEKTGKRSEAQPFTKNAMFGWGSRTPEDTTETVFWKFLMANYNQFFGGEVSLALIYALKQDLFAELSDDERQAIRFHDGGFGPGRKSGGNECALTIVIHMADMMASRFGE